MTFSSLKMYTLVLDDVPFEKAINSVGHATLACYKAFEKDEWMQRWLTESFKKVTCKVNAKEFEAAKKCEKVIVITESSLGGRDVAISFCPRPQNEWPNVVKYAKLYRAETFCGDPVPYTSDPVTLQKLARWQYECAVNCLFYRNPKTGEMMTRTEHVGIEAMLNHQRQAARVYAAARRAAGVEL